MKDAIMEHVMAKPIWNIIVVIKLTPKVKVMNSDQNNQSFCRIINESGKASKRKYHYITHLFLQK